MYTPEQIARTCHEANRAIQLIQADPGVPVAAPWDEFAEKEAVIDGVIKAQAGATPEQLHSSWYEFKKAEGYVYGLVKDAVTKTHPCMVAYGALPALQRHKDGVFKAIVTALSTADAAKFQRIILGATVFPSEERSIVALSTGDKFAGAHNYEIKPMLRYENGAVYGLEGMPLTFVKRNEDGSWQPGIQTEQLLHLLMDRHQKMNAVFPSDVHDEFMAHLAGALECLERRVRERTERGVMGQSVK